jgi:hypothetical protein
LTVTLSSKDLIWPITEPSDLNLPVMFTTPPLVLLIGASSSLSPEKNLVISITIAELSRL